ncbi:uncharacterized protein LOC121375490 [Gigantopelta aegis]|uniref:uncharacterized protein LOC121375490 n=1 Tax=Gigantopelta aegis TaxID=1735272 RepID=UPI001B88AF0F|nr:uncharacterized protein LOC121375490 [Gigantopelta aegis]
MVFCNHLHGFDMRSFSGKQNQMELSGVPESRVIAHNNVRRDQVCGPISYQWIMPQSPPGNGAASAVQEDPGLLCYILKPSLTRTYTPEAAATTAATTTTTAAAVCKQAQPKPDSGLQTCELVKQEPMAMSRNCVQPKSKSHSEQELLMQPDLEPDAINSKRRWQKIDSATRRISYSWVHPEQEPKEIMHSGVTCECELCTSARNFIWVDPKIVTYCLSKRRPNTSESRSCKC